MRGPDLGPNHRSRDNDLNPAVLLPAFDSRVLRHRIGFAQASRRDGFTRQSLGNQIITDRSSTLFRKLHIEIFGAGIIGVSLDCQLQLGIIEHNAGKLGQRLARRGTQIGFTNIKQHVAQVDHESALRIARGQHAVELLQQLGAQLLLVALGLGGGFLCLPLAFLRGFLFLLSLGAGLGFFRGGGFGFRARLRIFGSLGFGLLAGQSSFRRIRFRLGALYGFRFLGSFCCGLTFLGCGFTLLRLALIFGNTLLFLALH